MIIKAKGSYTTQSGAKYLNVFSASQAFSVSSKSQGLDETTVKAGYVYNLEKISEITLHNHSDNDLNVEFEISNLQVMVGSNAGVEVVNTPSIQRIIEPIAVTAKATVENGTMHVISGSHYNELPDKAINKRSKVTLLAANPNRKKATIQVISDTRTSVRFGSVNVSAGRGAFVSGSKSAPAVIDIETTGAIYVFNEDAVNTATLTITEVLK